MAYGDIGGAVTELVITCKAPSSGSVSITKGDALKLTGAYTVDNATDAEDALFGGFQEYGRGFVSESTPCANTQVIAGAKQHRDFGQQEEPERVVVVAAKPRLDHHALRDIPGVLGE